MTRRYAKLQKNVRELMHKLATLISFSEENPAPKQLIAEFEQQFSFAGNLLSAELASVGAKIPLRLRRINYRLKYLDEIFRYWFTGEKFPDGDDRRRFLTADSECSFTDDDEINGGDRSETEDLAIVAYDGKLSAEIEGECDHEVKECLVTEIVEENLISPGGVRGRRSVLVFGLVFLVVICFVALVVFCFSCYVDRYHGDYSYNVLTPT